MDTAQWPQEIMVNKPMEEIISNTCSSSITSSSNNNNNNNIDNNNHIINNNINNNKVSPSSSLERKVRPQKDQANCPRCNSTNTKFCYYNNYSLTQPRYFCKTCRRYWTEGGSLRNIPVGGGSRKNKRSSSSSSSSTSSSKKLSSHDLVAAVQSHLSHPNPNLNHHHHQGQDLNLGFTPTTHQQDQFRSLSEFIQLPTIDHTTAPTKAHQKPNTSDHHHHHLSALELLNGLTTSTRGLTPFMPMPVPDPNGVYSSGFPSLNFSLDGLGNGGYGSLQGGVQQAETNNGRLLFPFEDLKQAVSSNTSGGEEQHNNNNNNNNGPNNHEQTTEQRDSNTGYWSGMLGAGGSW